MLAQDVELVPTSPDPGLIGFFEILKGSIEEYHSGGSKGRTRSEDVRCRAKMKVKIPFGPYTRGLIIRLGDKTDITKALCGLLKQAKNQKGMVTIAGKLEMAGGERVFSVYTMWEVIEK